MQEMIGLEGGNDLVGKSACCKSLRTRVRIPSIHKEKPSVITCAYDPSTVGDGERVRGA